MYCPKCSQLQVPEDMPFCSRCGLPLSTLRKMISGDQIPADATGKVKDKLSPRHKGIRQGALLMLLSIILIPAYILLAALFPANDRLIESAVSDTPFEKISEAVLFTIFLLGLARILYAYLFQRGADREKDEPEPLALGRSTQSALPEAENIPASGFGAWRRNTDEMVQTASSAAHTTGSLQKDSSVDGL